jgi:hypothetical protein
MHPASQLFVINLLPLPGCGRQWCHFILEAASPRDAQPEYMQLSVQSSDLSLMLAYLTHLAHLTRNIVKHTVSLSELL